jgi:manganese efflux pump family protein
MGFIELSILAVALAMDAVAVSIAIGAKYKSFEPKYLALPPLSFGVFQGLMPLIGFLLGATFSSSDGFKFKNID